MGIAYTDGARIAVIDERLSSKLGEYIEKDRFKNFCTLKEAGQELSFPDVESVQTRDMSLNSNK